MMFVGELSPCLYFLQVCVFLMMFFLDVKVLDGDANDPDVVSKLRRNLYDLWISMLKLTAACDFLFCGTNCYKMSCSCLSLNVFNHFFTTRV